MFRSIKKRVKNALTDSVHGRNNSKHGNGGPDDGDTMNTPMRGYPGLPPPVPQATTSPSGNTVSTSGSDISCGFSEGQTATRKQQQQQQKQQSSNSGRPPTGPPTSYAARLMGGKKSKSILDVSLEELDVLSKIEHLAPFDVSVQAADALAAASGLFDHRQAKQTDAVMNERRIDSATGLPCTSVLVSPDGHMLLMPHVHDPKDIFSKHPGKEDINADCELQQRCENSKEKFAEGYGGSSEHSSSSVGDENESANFSELRLHGIDDYESSVYVGHDLHPAGDKEMNGFSAKGWSIPATSLALDQTEQSLNAFAHFCEQMVLTRKESAARTQIACDNLRRAASTIQQGKNSAQDLSGSWVIIDPRANDFEMTPRRTGPLLEGNSSLAAALSSFEEYYTTESEKEAHRWRTASLQRGNVLPKIHDAVDKLHERSLKRQQALQESSRRASVLEDRIRALQQLAQSKWEDVYAAEERVTIRQQQLMEERRQQKEKARLEKMQKDEALRAQETAAVNKGEAALGATSQEIWDMVSTVGVEEGSFEPIDLPTAPLAAPRDKSVSDDASVNSVDSANTETTIPIASRDEIGIELGLPTLRAMAMQADEAVRDTADTLLNVLSTLDTTRRSARIAAETCLLGACNAQAACLQDWIQLEKEALAERLNAITELEEKVKSTFNVRADLDTYITADKRERGGTSHLGDDDDGGVASALATLSSHVDGMLRGDAENPNNYLHQGTGADDEENESDNQIGTNETIEKIFEDNAEFRSHVENNTKSEFMTAIEALCKIAAEKSRGKRSAICYALNAKRSGHARLNSKIQFEALSTVFSAILTGCNAEVEVGGVSNAKMCMMLAQTFYINIDSESIGGNVSDGSLALSESSERGNSRIYIKSRLMEHEIWSKDDYWDVALSQQISESLTHSGVISNFEKTNSQPRLTSDYAQSRRIRWYDLNQTERIEAASQVHAVVCAQVGALAHSMLEFGCGLDRACAFVRRMSIRNQLPSSHRTMLLMHLIGRKESTS